MCVCTITAGLPLPPLLCIFPPPAARKGWMPALYHAVLSLTAPSPSGAGQQKARQDPPSSSIGAVPCRVWIGGEGA